MGKRGPKSKANRAERRKGTCVYCGKAGNDLEREDVIPLCLFLKPANDRIIVPSCRPCNLAKSKNDDLLRDMLVADEDSFDSPVARRIFATKVLDSVKRGSSVVGKKAISGASFEPVHTKGGIYLNHGWSVTLDAKRIDETFATVVRGLYYRVYDKRLPDDCVFTTMRVKRIEAPRMIDFTHSVWGPSNYGCIGQGVFECIYWSHVKEPYLSEWILKFYNGVYFVVTTCPSAVLDSFGRAG